MIETSGRPNPGFLTIAKLAKGLRISMDALASECAWDGASEATSSLETTDRERLATLREIETAKGEAQRVVSRLEALLEKKAAASKKQGKRKKSS